MDFVEKKQNNGAVLSRLKRKGARVVEWDGLENR